MKAALAIAGCTTCSLLLAAAAGGLLGGLARGGMSWAAPDELRTTADQAARSTGVDATVLLAIAYRQTAFGQARSDLSDDLVPADIRSAVDLAALGPEGATTRALHLAGGRRLGDWIAADPVEGERGIGFLELRPSLWRAEAPRAPQSPRDPYQPLGSLVVAGNYLGRLQAEGSDLRIALTVLGGGSFAEDVMRLIAIARGSGQPMSCPGYRLSQGYGPVDFALEPPLFGYPHFHSGWDLVCPAGTPVTSVTSGTATVHVDPAGFGISVVVVGGDLYVRYAHLAASSVASGQAVFTGQQIGQEGSTGNSTGPHLHFEVDRGCPMPRCSVNPAELITVPGGG